MYTTLTDAVLLGVIPHAELTVLAALAERSLFVGCKYRHTARAEGRVTPLG
jgi:hypothetical protein